MLTKKKGPGSLAHRLRAPLAMVSAVVMGLTMLPAASGANDLPTTDDPRVDLAPGLLDAETTGLGMDLVGHVSKWDTPFAPPMSSPGTFAYVNSDMAFSGDNVLQGNYQGFQVYDISDPTAPALRTSVLCPGGQGDVNVYGNLAFQSVEEASGRVDCGTEGALSLIHI